jgi:class 3 adenylate cyclase
MGRDEEIPRVGGGVAVHVVVYISVNLLLIAVWLFSTTGAQLDQVSTYLTNPTQAKDAGFWPLYVIVFWGFGLLIHAGIMIVTAPSRYRRKRARAKARRQMQANVVGALGNGFLGDAAVAGIRAVDGDKAAKKVEREAGRTRSNGRTSSRPRKEPGRGRPPQRRSDAHRGDGSAVAPPPTDPPVVDGDPAPANDGDVASTLTPGRQWVAVLFTDIVDSTTLNHSLGDEDWARLLAEHRRLIRECVATHHGVEVGTQGDGFLLRFDDPDHAATCAIEIQQRLLDARAALGDQAPLHVRIGIHAGEVVQDDDDIIGTVINLAARVTSAAGADEILVTEPFADHLSSGHILLDRGLKSLKGFAQPRHLLAIAWQVVPDEIVLDDRSDR